MLGFCARMKTYQGAGVRPIMNPRRKRIMMTSFKIPRIKITTHIRIPT